MSRDRSLDEFLRDESDASPADGPDADGDGTSEATGADDAGTETDASGSSRGPDPGSDGGQATPASEPADGGTENDDPGSEASGDDGGVGTTPDEVDPAATTYRWSPDGVACTECGTTVGELWSGESGPVCGECKEW